MSEMADKTSKRREVTKWQSFIQAFQGLEPLTRFITEAEEREQEASKLKAEVDKLNNANSQLAALSHEQKVAHEAEVLQLKTTRTTLLDDCNRRYDEWRRALAEAEAEKKRELSLRASTTEHKLQSLQAEISSVKAENIRLRQRLDSAEDALTEKTAVLTGKMEQLRLAEHYRENLEQQMGIMSSLSLRESSQVLETMQSQISELCHQHLQRDFDDETFLDPAFKAIGPLMTELSLTLPISNSAVSKSIRAAATEAIIARCAHRNILQTPLYSRALRSDDVLRLCNWISNGKGSASYTALCAMLAASMGVEDMREMISAAVEEVLGFVSPLLRDQQRDFSRELEAILSRLAQLWRSMQRSGLHVLSHLAAAPDSQDGVQGVLEESERSHYSHDPFSLCLITFPRFMVVGYDSPIHAGCVIWKASKLARDAAAEADQQRTRLQIQGQTAQRSERGTELRAQR